MNFSFEFAHLLRLAARRPNRGVGAVLELPLESSFNRCHNQRDVLSVHVFNPLETIRTDGPENESRLKFEGKGRPKPGQPHANTNLIYSPLTAQKGQQQSNRIARPHLPAAWW